MSNIPTSLPACAKSHPGVPSIITMHEATSANGKAFQRPSCNVCRSRAAKRRREEDRSEAGRRGFMAATARADYGVFKMNWPDPMALLAQELV